MPRHYVKLLDWIEQYAREVGAASGAWQDEVFQDITERGERIRYVTLVPTLQGPRLGLCGDKFFCEVGLDKDRDDTLFVSRIESADTRLPTVPPGLLEADFRLTTQQSLRQSTGESIAGLFGKRPTQSPQPVIPQPLEARNLSESLRTATVIEGPLVELVRRKKQALMDICAPIPWSGQDTSDEEFVATIRRLWTRHRLGRFANPSVRQMGLLAGRIKPQALSDVVRREYLYVFDVDLFARWVRSEIPDDVVVGAIGALAQLGLATSVRASIWCAALAEMDGNELRVVLHNFARKVESTELEVGDGQVLRLTNSIARVAERDDALRQVLEQACTSSAPLGTLLEWARRLAVRDTPDELVPVTTVAYSREYASQIELAELAKPSLSLTSLRSGGPPAIQAAHDIPPSPIRLLTSAIRRAVTQVSSGRDAELLPRVATPAAPAALEIAMPTDVQFLDWLLALQSFRVDEVADLRDKVAETVKLAADMLRAADNPHVLVQAIAELDKLQRHIPAWLEALPCADQLQADTELAVKVYPNIQALLGDDIIVLVELALSPDDARQIVDLMQNESTLWRLPDWIWDGPEESESGAAIHRSGQRARIFSALASPELRTTVTKTIERLCNVHAKLLGPLRDLPPPDGISLDAYVDRAVTSLEEQARELAEVPSEHINWTFAALDAGVSADEVVATVRRVRELQAAVSESVYGLLATDLCSADSWAHQVAIVSNWRAQVDRVVQLMGDASTLSVEQWKRLHQTLARDTRPMPSPSPPLEFAFDHNFVDRKSRRVPLVYRAYVDRDAPYGSVKLPFVIECEQRPALAIETRIRVLTGHRDNWPEHWRAPSPRRLAVNPLEWTARSGLYVHEFTVEIPLRPPTAQEVRGARFRVELTGLEPGSENVMVPARVFEWDSMDLHDLEVPFAWPEMLDPGYVERQPVGPQRDHEKILLRLGQGSSFAVVAPRRFGKSTLVEYLHVTGRGRPSPLLVLKPVVCTQYDDGETLDFDRLWRDLSNELIETVGAGIAIQPGEVLPGAAAFRHATKQAKSQDWKAIVILVDEAQLFFRQAGTQGYVLGDRLKDHLERHWTAAQGGVPVLFGLVGLTSLNERAGTNLMALLRPYEYTLLDEEELKRLILNVTDGKLYTTRDARQVMVERSGNLYVLKTPLDRLVRVVNRDEREWATRYDVLEMVSELRRSLEAGGERHVANYMRDVLNDAESVNEWKPKPCFATTVALASLAGVRAEPGDLMTALITQLNGWCEQVSWLGGRFPVYSLERVEEHLKTLRNLDVYRDEAFASPLLEAYLFGCARSFPLDEAEEQALYRGALQRIREPEVMEPIDVGGQASVYLFNEKGVRYALRKVALRTQEERLRFNERVDTLSSLKQRIRNHEGSQYIYDLDRIGLSMTDGFGLEIYRWIEGGSLEQKRLQLPARAVAEIAVRLARGLDALHAHNILHRDVRPRNIVLAEETLVPVLVDFGLARLASAKMATVLADDMVAPEVRQEPPKWGKAADIYALGKTLGALVAPSEKGSTLLQVALDQCCHERPDQRPTAAHAVELFRKAEAKFNIDRTVDETWGSLALHAQEGSTLRLVMEKFRPHIKGLVIGLFHSTFERCAEVSLFLDQVVEAHSNGNLKLGELKNDCDFKGVDLRGPPLDFVHALRLERTHWKLPHQQRSLLRKHNDPSDEKMRALVVEAAMKLGEALEIRPLSAIVVGLFDAASSWN